MLDFYFWQSVFITVSFYKYFSLYFTADLALSDENVELSGKTQIVVAFLSNHKETCLTGVTQNCEKAGSKENSIQNIISLININMFSQRK